MKPAKMGGEAVEDWSVRQLGFRRVVLAKMLLLGMLACDSRPELPAPVSSPARQVTTHVAEPSVEAVGATLTFKQSPGSLPACVAGGRPLSAGDARPALDLIKDSERKRFEASSKTARPGRKEGAPTVFVLCGTAFKIGGDAAMASAVFIARRALPGEHWELHVVRYATADEPTHFYFRLIASEAEIASEVRILPMSTKPEVEQALLVSLPTEYEGEDLFEVYGTSGNGPQSPLGTFESMRQCEDEACEKAGYHRAPGTGIRLLAGSPPVIHTRSLRDGKPASDIEVHSMQDGRFVRSREMPHSAKSWPAELGGLVIWRRRDLPKVTPLDINSADMSRGN